MRKYLLPAIVVVALAVLQQAGVFWTPPPSAAALRGVVESTDSQELPDDIFVIATWKAQTGMSSSHCVHMEVTKTDSEGNWSFPMWQDWRHNRRAVLFIEVYSPGQIATPDNIVQDRWHVREHHGPLSEYLEYLRRLRVYCGAADQSNFNGVSVWKSILMDILDVSQSTQPLSEGDARRVDSLRWAFAVKVVDPNFELGNDVRYEKAEVKLREMGAPR